MKTLSTLSTLAVLAGAIAYVILILESHRLIKPWQATIALIALCGMTLLAVLVWIVAYIWQTWLRWTVKVSEGPAPQETLANVVSMHLDPIKGLVMNVLHGDTVIPTLVNPMYWHFLPSPVLSREDKTECSIAHSPLMKVQSNSEPTSLVGISNEKEIVGFGARVKFEGKTYLLTAYHVWFGKSAKLFLAKGDIQTEVPCDLGVTYGCENLAVDFVMVDVPDNIWARLGVKAVGMSTMEKRSVVTAYGGDSMKALTCSSAIANKGEYSHDIVHGCTTTHGWSGTPLYYKGVVVGIHTGYLEFGKSNRGVNVGLLLVENKNETVYSEITNTRIDPDEAESRGYEFLEVDIIGRGRLGIGRGEYYHLEPPHSRPFETADRITRLYGSHDNYNRSVRERGGVVWADLETTKSNTPEDLLQVLPRTSARLIPTLETSKSHLNFQGAESISTLPNPLGYALANGLPRKSLLPPSLSLETTNGSASQLKSETRECLSPLLEDRVLNLEKVIERLCLMQSSLPTTSSQNSKALIGPSEAQKPNLGPSSSKPVGSRRQRRRKTSSQPVEQSPNAILVPNPTPASVEKNGTVKKSGRRSRKSAKAVSTQKPHQVSPSVSSAKPIELS